MYALHDSGLAVNALPTQQPAMGPTDQLERRAVEATEHGPFQAEDHTSSLYSSTSAVLQLVESSAQGYDEILASGTEGGTMVASANTDADAGQEVDVYA